MKKIIPPFWKVFLLGTLTYSCTSVAKRVAMSPDIQIEICHFLAKEEGLKQCLVSKNLVHLIDKHLLKRYFTFHHPYNLIGEPLSSEGVLQDLKGGIPFARANLIDYIAYDTSLRDFDQPRAPLIEVLNLLPEQLTHLNIGGYNATTYPIAYREL